MNTRNKPIRVAVTGPESTGKTTLAKQLAEAFDGLYIPEYAREYVESLDRPYTYDDVESIAGFQVKQYLDTLNIGHTYIFFDTWLIISKIWFTRVFSKTPDWLEDRIKECPIDLFLLCQPDLPWEPDAVRENGGETRVELFHEYREQLINYGFRFAEIGGSGDERFQRALEVMKDMKTLGL